MIGSLCFRVSEKLDMRIVAGSRKVFRDSIHGSCGGGGGVWSGMSPVIARLSSDPMYVPTMAKWKGWL